MIGFPTNLARGDSWNPIVRMGADVADLEVTGIGKIECRPVNPGDSEYSIPPEVWLDRIGYIFVEINLTEREATILGFTPQARGVVSLNQLRSLEEFLDRLHGLMTTPVEQLYRWLEGLDNAITTGWQSVESLFSNRQFAFRSIPNAITKGKVIDLGIQLAGQTIALIVSLVPAENPDNIDIWVRVLPTNTDHLPPNLGLIILDEFDRTFLQAASRATDDLVQLRFNGETGERFSIVVRLGNAEVKEQFVL
jgi:hypothetical protein